MATTFSTATDFMLVAINTEKVDGGRKPAGVSTEAQEDYSWFRKQYTVTIERYGQGLSAYDPIVDTTKAGNLVTFKNGSDTIGLNAALTLECIDNPLYELERASGMWREVQVWQWRGDWAEEAIAT